jgi:YegS/Rv2252/BmrU family lipid kinase
MANKKRIIFIMNPISGTIRKSGIPKIIEKTLDKEYYEFSIAETNYSGHAYEIAKDAKEKGFYAVVAVGGDGTVNEVAKAIVHSDTALGILPCGSGNGLARHLMLPLDIQKAVEVINMHTVHDLDYGLINNIPFFCTCGMGFDAFISMKFAEAGKRGPVTYLENILREGLKYKPETYEIIDENGTSIRRAFLISCANASQYGNNAYIAPQASMSDGLLDITIMEPLDMIEASQISIDMFNKTLNNNSKIKTFKTKHIQVHREKAGFIHYDGEPVMTDADVDISVVNKGIKIIVNPLAQKYKREPNMMQTAFSVFFNDIMNVRADKNKQVRHIQTLNKILLKKLNNL